ncbi:MAG: hypothetical protein UY72_C0016G0005 [Candidatus Uhrbacteria bacterium GW2011_GWD2_52_7]|uniref:Uncharacterized protein n=1 Tax=Candidatus Uhrbacteria bacterium GW2011_GWD2_52_7 TaxID=1618989 RepID=A0A0G1ZPY8_9BACT|nr:MAG: hypothetical protein UY72_C0016G0005 [Candidatus Uhrbacteria bacterium GW2011_GWD2_52_7]
MNTNRLSLPHPLSCLMHAYVHRSAARGEQWQGERSMRRFFASMGSLLLLITLAPLWAIIFPRASDVLSYKFIVIFGGFEILVGWVFGGGVLCYSLIKLRELGRQTNKRMSAEQLIVDDVFLSLNAQLADYWEKELQPRLAHPDLRTPDEHTALKEAVNELARIDRELYHISTLMDTRESRSDLAIATSVPEYVEELRKRKLPPEVADMGGI